MTPREIVRAQIEHRETSPVPYTLGFESGVAEQLDAHYGTRDWRERLVPYMTHCGGIPTMAKERVDEAHEVDRFGTLWRIDRRPFHLERPAMPEPSFEGYEFPGPEAFVNPTLKDDAAKALEAHPHGFSLVHIPWGLWETYWGIRGFENAMMDCVAEPDFFEELLDRLTELFLTHVAQCAAVAADAVMFGDDWGGQRGVLIGPERWRRYFKPRYARIYEAVHAQGKIAISHCCGSVADILPDIIEIGLDVLESVQPEAQGMNPYDLKRQWGDRIAFWGCLGSQSTIPFGTPDEIRAEVRRLRAEMGRGGGFILAPAKSLQPGTPTENAVAVFEAFTEET